MKLLVLILALVAVNSAQECRDLDWRCPIYRQYCRRGGSIGEMIRTRCPKTCGLCHRPTLPPGTTFPPHIGGCGQPDVKGVSRVVAGKTAVPHSWPWQILMLFGGQAICGGTLIAPEWVVTAAHCVYRREHSGAFSIRVGEHDRENFEGPEQNIRVVKVFRHEGYDPNQLNNDIAMFKLERPVKFNKYVSPACLPKANVPPGSDCYITGWGKTHHPGTMTRFLQQGLLPVVSNEDCYKKNHVRIPIPITDAMICGGSGGTERTSGCHGDSGGPFVCKVNGVWELHGSVSHGSPVCKSTETYTVFSRTFHFLDWIKKNMESG